MKKVKVVIGSNFGDEGKGLMTDYFCHKSISKGESCIVVCSNGGAQRGHTVVTPSKSRHIFHHFGSGSLAGADTYLPKEFILNPMIFRKEWNDLKTLGCTPRVFVHPDCRWSTPWDMMANQIKEDFRGDERHGSVGVGIWETIERYESRKYDSLIEFSNKSNMKKIDYLESIRNKYLVEFSISYGLPKAWENIFTSQDLLERFLDDIDFMMNHITFVSNGILQSYDSIVFENGQGLLLDQSLIDEFGDNLTPSNTGILNAMNLIQSVFWEADVEVCYVTRTYNTRHGAGKFEGECDYREINLSLYDRTNIPNPYQGELRYGKLNVEKLLERIDQDFSTAMKSDCINCIRWRKSLAVTHLNEYDFEEDLEYISNDFDFLYKSDSEDRSSVCRE